MSRKTARKKKGNHKMVVKLIPTAKKFFNDAIDILKNAKYEIIIDYSNDKSSGEAYFRDDDADIDFEMSYDKKTCKLNAKNQTYENDKIFSVVSGIINARNARLRELRKNTTEQPKPIVESTKQPEPVGAKTTDQNKKVEIPTKGTRPRRRVRNSRN